jgi:hypothetical protein
MLLQRELADRFEPGLTETAQRAMVQTVMSASRPKADIRRERSFGRKLEQMALPARLSR